MQMSLDMLLVISFLTCSGIASICPLVSRGCSSIVAAAASLWCLLLLTAVSSTHLPSAPALALLAATATTACFIPHLCIGNRDHIRRILNLSATVLPLIGMGIYLYGVNQLNRCLYALQIDVNGGMMTLRTLTVLTIFQATVAAILRKRALPPARLIAAGSLVIAFLCLAWYVVEGSSDPLPSDERMMAMRASKYVALPLSLATCYFASTLKGGNEQRARIGLLASAAASALTFFVLKNHLVTLAVACSAGLGYLRDTAWQRKRVALVVIGLSLLIISIMLLNQDGLLRWIHMPLDRWDAGYVFYNDIEMLADAPAVGDASPKALSGYGELGDLVQLAGIFGWLAIPAVIAAIASLLLQAFSISTRLERSSGCLVMGAMVPVAAFALSNTLESFPILPALDTPMPFLSFSPSMLVFSTVFMLVITLAPFIPQDRPDGTSIEAPGLPSPWGSPGDESHDWKQTTL